MNALESGLRPSVTPASMYAASTYFWSGERLFAKRRVNANSGPAPPSIPHEILSGTPSLAPVL